MEGRPILANSSRRPALTALLAVLLAATRPPLLLAMKPPLLVAMKPPQLVATMRAGTVAVVATRAATIDAALTTQGAASIEALSALADPGLLNGLRQFILEGDS